VSRLALNANADLAATLDVDDVLRVWDVQRGEVVVAAPEAGILDMGFTADGSALVVARTTSIRRYPLRRSV
jgi:hypothetical protein